jgi:uncharacterized RDD family membrane protein YckC
MQYSPAVTMGESGMSKPQQWDPPAYGALPPQGFGPPPLPPGVTYASWGLRAAAFLVDVLALFALLIPVGAIGGGLVEALSDPVTNEPPVWAIVLAVVLGLAVLGVWLRMYSWQAGSIGQSWGKRVVGIHLVAQRTLRPPGGWTGVGRYLLRSALGNASCGLYTLVTFLWPLWDERNQTLDDKIVNTVVIRFPDRRLPPAPRQQRTPLPP